MRLICGGWVCVNVVFRVWLRFSDGWNIKRMTWRSILISAEAMNASESRQNFNVALSVGSVCSPCCQNKTGTGAYGCEPIVIQRAARISLNEHNFWISGAKRKKVRHAKCPESPPFCKVNAASNGRIILRLIRCRRIQADHHEIPSALMGRFRSRK